MSEVTALLEKQAKAFEAFKETNDKRVDALESKNETLAAEHTEKLGKIEADLQTLGKDYADALKKAQRPATGSDEQTDEQIEHAKAFKAFLRTGNDVGLAGLQRSAALESGSDPDGGYLILPEMDSMIDRVVGTISSLGRLAKNVTIGSAKWEKLIKTSGLTMRRVSDGSTGGETDNPNYAKIGIEVFTAEVEPWVFNETLEDAFINLEADLAEEAAIGFGEGAGSEFVSGNGVGKARGITAYDTVANASYAWGSLGYIASGASGAFTSSAPADTIVSLQHSLKQQYRPGAAFLMNDASLATVRKMKDASGAYYLWNPDPLVGFGGRLLGSPVEIDDNMPDISANSLSIAFGNFERGYAVVNRSGVTLIRDNITAKGKTKFNFRKRFGGGVYNFEAIKLMKFASS